jgi:ABC-2 type transport system ATP-binding protein
VSRAPGEIGWVPQQAALYRRLTVDENLRLFARLEGVADVDATVERMLDQTALRARRGDQVSRLSGGMQQRVNIAIGLIAQPVAMLLDEPSAGLDPGQRERLWEFVLALAGAGTTVLFSTHNIAEAERYGERLLVLADGEVIFDGPPPELHRQVVAGAANGGEETIASFEHAFVSFLRQRGH